MIYEILKHQESGTFCLQIYDSFKRQWHILDDQGSLISGSSQTRYNEHFTLEFIL